MNTIRKTFIVVGLLALFAVMAVPTLAAVTKIVTLTETQINESYWVTNPSWRAVTDRSVDLKAGQVVVSETITPRNGSAISCQRHLYTGDQQRAHHLDGDGPYQQWRSGIR